MENIYKAFIQFQSEFKGMQPNAKNPFFKSTYISLDGILETVRPLLCKHGLAIMQEATGDGEYIFVKTKLIHESGEMIETDTLKMKPQKNDPQSMGSCITYSKRYQLAALIGICESVDDDANKASDKTYQDNNLKEVAATNNLSEKQIKRLIAIGLSAGVNEAGIKKVAKHDYSKENLNELSKVEYDSICKRLEEKAKTLKQ